MKKHIKYTEITKLDTLVSLLGDDRVIFYIKMGWNDYMPLTAQQIVTNDRKYLVHLMRQSKLFYTL